MGIGKNILELLSAAMIDSVWRYLNWRAVGEAAITPAASFNAREALSSPWAEITCKNTRVTKLSEYATTMPYNQHQDKEYPLVVGLCILVEYTTKI